MELTRHYILAMPATISVEDFCYGITKHIFKVYKSLGISIKQLKEHPEERITANAVIYSEHRHEIWLVGDCQCLIDGILHDNIKPREKTLAERRSEYLNNELTSGRITIQDVIHGNDPGRRMIFDDLVHSCMGQNKEFAVIDGFPILLSNVKIIKLALGLHEIVLASDGYPYLCPSLADSETALNQLLSKDPLCINIFKATKGIHEGLSSFDDRAYIRLTTNY